MAKTRINEWMSTGCVLIDEREFASEIAIADQFIDWLVAERGDSGEWWPRWHKLDPYAWVRECDDVDLARFAIVCIQAVTCLEASRRQDKTVWSIECKVRNVAARLFSRKLRFTIEQIDLALDLSECYEFIWAEYKLIRGIVDAAARLAIPNGLPFTTINRLRRLQRRLSQDVHARSERRVLTQLAELAGVGDDNPIQPGDAWSNVARQEIGAMDDADRAAWITAIRHALSCNPTRPSKRWREEAVAVGSALSGKLVPRLRRWVAEIGKPGDIERQVGWTDHTDRTLLDPANEEVLSGLVWMAALSSDDSVCATIAHAAELAFRRVRFGGPRCESLGKACVRALGEMPGEAPIAQLSRLDLRIKHPPSRKLIKKVFNASIERAGLSVDDVEEAMVPDMGLRNGVAAIHVGEVVGEISVEDMRTPRIRWIKPDGKASRAVPRGLKANHPDGVQEVKRLSEDIESMIAAQRRRLERIFLEDRRWSFERWKALYDDHELIRTLARRLIWFFEETPAAFIDGAWRALDGVLLKPGSSDTVRLWHPIGRAVEEIVSWRQTLEDEQITQPFKQAHREIYVLTDAEHRTNVYSNRFAAHVLKNHVLVALCQTRRWRSGMFGGDTGPRLELPRFELAAEYWVDAIENDDWNADYDVPNFVATDQVRFFRLTDVNAPGTDYNARGDDPNVLPLTDIPPLVFSEIMRDVDLFVGVASVGNDPTWEDGGPDGRYREYWHEYSFGDLGATAKTRKEVLERLLPRLKIGPCCAIEDAKWLVVRGDRRTYKIHLGSGNILMKPNDQYLCIVPGRSVDRAVSGKVFLPFEGDRTLSIILSKAFMLADDRKITDQTILSQIGR